MNVYGTMYQGPTSTIKRTMYKNSRAADLGAIHVALCWVVVCCVVVCWVVLGYVGVLHLFSMFAQQLQLFMTFSHFCIAKVKAYTLRLLAPLLTPVKTLSPS